MSFWHLSLTMVKTRITIKAKFKYMFSFELQISVISIGVLSHFQPEILPLSNKFTLDCSIELKFMLRIVQHH